MASPTAPLPPTAAHHAPEWEAAFPVAAEVSSDLAAACDRRTNGSAPFPTPGHRRTPDHPPYAEMIQVALRALTEEGGSTVPAISDRIAAVYHDLPWAHERLLPHYLRRLVAAGDVSVSAPGCYILSSYPAPTGDADPQPPCSGPTPVATDPDGIPAAPAATPRSPSDTVAALDNGAGVGLGSRSPAVTMATASSCGDGKSQCHHSLIPAIAVSHDGDAERSSMRDPTSAAALVVWKDGRPFEYDLPSSTNTGQHTCFLESKGRVKRRRGRPPLRAKRRGRPPYGMRCHWEPACGTCVSDPGGGGTSLPECRKGSSPNSFILSRHGQDSWKVCTPSMLPRRGRGRPPKCKPTVVTLDPILANEDVHLLSFTSSHDPKHAELNGDIYSSWSLGDGTSSVMGRELSNCSAAYGTRSILRLPSNPECKLANDSLTPDLSSLADEVAVHAPKRQRTAVDHKPRKISTPLFEERASNEPLIQGSEQMVSALPASIDSSSNNVIRSRPQIEGWVQVLLAVQPATTNVKRAREKKSRRDGNEGKLDNPTEQFRPDSFPLIQYGENLDQGDGCLCTFVSKCSSTGGLLQDKVDENRTHMDRCMFSAPILDPDVSFQKTEKENLLHADKGEQSMSHALFQVMEEENGSRDVEGRQTLHIGYSVLDSSLQTGNEESRTQAGGHVELLPSEHFTVGYSLQTSLENAANTERSKQLPDTRLSKPEDDLKGEKEKNSLHADVHLLELPPKQLLTEELLANEPQDGRCVQKFHVGESDAKRCLQVLSKFGDSLQTDDKSEPPSGECVLTCTAEQYALGDLSHSQESDNNLQVKEFVQELHAECSMPVHDLQSEKKNEPHVEGCVQVLPHEQAKLNDSFLFENDKNGTHAIECTIEFSAKDPTICVSYLMHQLEEGSNVGLFNQELPAGQKSPGDVLQTKDIDGSYDEKYVQVRHEEQLESGADLLSETSDNRRCALRGMLALQEKGSTNGNYFQTQELENGPQDEEFTQGIHIDHHRSEDNLQISHANEGVQMILQEQHKPGDDLQMEDRSRAHTKGLALQFPLKDANAYEIVQNHESETSTQTREFIQELPSKMSKHEFPLQIDETNELFVDDFIETSVAGPSKTDDPLQLKGEKNVSLKNKKRPHSRKLWFEG